MHACLLIWRLEACKQSIREAKVNCQNDEMITTTTRDTKMSQWKLSIADTAETLKKTFRYILPKVL